MQCNENDFTLVQSKKRNKGKKVVRHQKHIQNFNNLTSETTLDNLSSAIKRINETQIDIITSEFYKQTINQLNSVIIDGDNKTGTRVPIEQIICFGIGHISSCSIARHQLAYILAIRKEFNVKSIEFHEPALTSLEKSILVEFNCKIYPINLEGKRLIDQQSTILYLPHCPKQLTNNLLWRNWTATSLQNIALLIGNSFASIIESTPERFLKQDAEYLLKIFPFTTEIKFPNNFRHTDIFNDLSIHLFKVNTVDVAIWTDNCEPKYLDSCTELIENLQII